MSKSIPSWLRCCALLGLLIWQFAGSECYGGEMVKAVLRVRSSVPTVWLGAESKFDPAAYNFYKHNLAALIKTPLVIDKALDSNDVRELKSVKQQGKEHVAQWLADQIVVEVPADSELISVGMADDENHEASVVVNAVVNAFLREVVEKERTDKLVRRDQLDKKFRAYKSNVLEKERQLSEFNQQIGTADAETAKVRMRIEVADLEGLMQSRAEAQKAIAELAMKIQMAKALAASSEKGQVSDARMDEAIAKDPQITQAVNDLNALHHEEREIRSGEPSDRHSRLEQLAVEADRAEMQAELQIERGKHRLAGLADSSAEYKAIKSEIDLAEVDRKFWSGKSASLSEQSRENAKLRIREAIVRAECSVEELRSADRQRLIESIKRDADLGGSNVKALELQQQLLTKQFEDTTKAIALQSESVQKLEKFDGEADQLHTEITQLQNVVNEIGNTLTQWNIELDAAPRVEEMSAAGR